jgi:hypothetical protein
VLVVSEDLIAPMLIYSDILDSYADI